MGHSLAQQGRRTHQGDDDGWLEGSQTMQIYVRKAGVDIKGATEDCLDLHDNSVRQDTQVFQIQ